MLIQDGHYKMEFKEQCEKRLGSCGRGEAQPTTGTSARCRREWGLLHWGARGTKGKEASLVSKLIRRCSRIGGGLKYA